MLAVHERIMINESFLNVTINTLKRTKNHLHEQIILKGGNFFSIYHL